MNGASRVALAASLLVVAALYAGVGAAAPAGLAAAALLGAAALGPRFALGATAQRLVAVGLAGVGVAAALLLAPGDATGPGMAHGEGLGRLWSALAGAMLLAAAGRLGQRAPEGGIIATVSLGLMALMACGETRAGPAYAVAVVGFLGLALLSMRAADPGRPVLSAIPARSWALGGAALGIAAAASLVLLRVLPPLEQRVTNYLMGSMSMGAGFSERLWLGSLDGMLQSDEVVLRLEGPANAVPRPTSTETLESAQAPEVDHLRGVVYDRYEAGGWTATRAGGTRPVPRVEVAGEGAVRATLLGGRRDRYFLPLGARRVAPGDADAVADRFGAVRVPRGEATSVTFELGGAPDLEPVGPTDKDLVVPPALRPAVDHLAAAWTSGATEPAEKVAAIARRLQSDFSYSLTFQRRSNREPLLEFLLEDRRGHCEYFASAMAVLARAAGVPARVVVGYRVAETSPLGGYAIVRERDAHAWVEVHLPGRGWQTVDATPPAAFASDGARRTPLAEAVGDLLGVGWAAVTRALEGWTVTALGALAALLGAAWVALRMRRRGPRVKRSAQRAPEEAAPPELARLLEALGRRRVERPTSEPLERFARRLEEAGFGEAAEVVERYAALRYGGEGDRAEVLAALEACALRIGRGR